MFFYENGQISCFNSVQVRWHFNTYFFRINGGCYVGRKVHKGLTLKATSSCQKIERREFEWFNAFIVVKFLTINFNIPIFLYYQMHNFDQYQIGSGQYFLSSETFLTLPSSLLFIASSKVQQPTTVQNTNGSLIYALYSLQSKQQLASIQVECFLNPSDIKKMILIEEKENKYKVGCLSVNSYKNWSQILLLKIQHKSDITKIQIEGRIRENSEFYIQKIQDTIAYLSYSRKKNDFLRFGQAKIDISQGKHELRTIKQKLIPIQLEQIVLNVDGKMLIDQQYCLYAKFCNKYEEKGIISSDFLNQTSLTFDSLRLYQKHFNFLKTISKRLIVSCLDYQNSQENRLQILNKYSLELLNVFWLPEYASLKTKLLIKDNFQVLVWERYKIGIYHLNGEFCEGRRIQSENYRSEVGIWEGKFVITDSCWFYVQKQQWVKQVNKQFYAI